MPFFTLPHPSLTSCSHLTFSSFLRTPCSPIHRPSIDRWQCITKQVVWKPKLNTSIDPFSVNIPPTQTRYTYSVTSYLNSFLNPNFHVTIAYVLRIPCFLTYLVPSSPLVLLSIPLDLTSHTMNSPSLGVIYYQKGDALSAIPYIEMAVKGNKTYEVM